MRCAIRTISADTERLSKPVTGSRISGAELPVTMTGLSSGMVLSYFGSRPRNVNLGGKTLMYLSTIARGN